MFPRVARVMWHQIVRGQVYLRDRGLHLRPKIVNEAHHQTEYDALVERLQRYLMVQENANLSAPTSKADNRTNL